MPIPGLPARDGSKPRDTEASRTVRVLLLVLKPAPTPPPTPTEGMMVASTHTSNTFPPAEQEIEGALCVLVTGNETVSTVEAAFEVKLPSLKLEAGLLVIDVGSVIAPVVLLAKDAKVGKTEVASAPVLSTSMGDATRLVMGPMLAEEARGVLMVLLLLAKPDDESLDTGTAGLLLLAPIDGGLKVCKPDLELDCMAEEAGGTTGAEIEFDMKDPGLLEMSSLVTTDIACDSPPLAVGTMELAKSLDAPLPEVRALKRDGETVIPPVSERVTMADVPDTAEEKLGIRRTEVDLESMPLDPGSGVDPDVLYAKDDTTSEMVSAGEEDDICPMTDVADDVTPDMTDVERDNILYALDSEDANRAEGNVLLLPMVGPILLEIELGDMLCPAMSLLSTEDVLLLGRDV